MRNCTFCGKYRKIICLDWQGFWCRDCYYEKHEDAIKAREEKEIKKMKSFEEHKDYCGRDMFDNRQMLSIWYNIVGYPKCLHIKIKNGGLEANHRVNLDELRNVKQIIDQAIKQLELSSQK